jgi:hypothetical protein
MKCDVVWIQLAQDRVLQLDHCNETSGSMKKKQKNSVALIRKGTIPTERPPPVGEVSANFCRLRVLRGQRNEFPRPLISVF